MKLMIASDIHGSAYFCKALLDAFAREGADRLLLLGDILYHGPRNDLPRDYCPRDVAALLNAVKKRILCVRGNCEAEVDQMVLEFPVLCEHALLEVNGLTLFATHGHHYNEENLPPLSEGTVFLSGHTHVPVCHELAQCACLNPGSVSLPKEDTPHGCILLEGRTFRFMTLEGEVYREWTAR